MNKQSIPYGPYICPNCKYTAATMITGAVIGGAIGLAAEPNPKKKLDTALKGATAGASIASSFTCKCDSCQKHYDSHEK